jgi:Glyoxalase-like domain
MKHDATTTVAAAITAVNLEADDPQALAEFWAAATGGTTLRAGDQVYVRPAQAGGVGMFIGPLAGPRPSRNLTHIDLTVPWEARAGLVDRLLGLGATHLWDVLDEHASVRWTTLADPEGNLLCVAEHLPAQD